MDQITKDTTMNEQQPGQQSEQTGKTFTQAEVNKIISDRLARDREKRTAELDEREKAVKARELAVIAAEKLAAAGLPKDLNAVLRYDDEDCRVTFIWSASSSCDQPAFFRSSISLSAKIIFVLLLF